MMKISTPRLLRRRPKRISRSFVRYECEIDGMMTLIDRMVSFEGRAIDISRGGALFRPKLAYLMRRNDQPVCVSIAGLELFGQIVATSSAGFSIRFDEPIDDEDFESLTAHLRVEADLAA
jgi:hypothetical protein